MSWQSRQVRVSQLSQNSTRGSCLCTLQYTVRSPSLDLAGPGRQDHEAGAHPQPPPTQGADRAWGLTSCLSYNPGLSVGKTQRTQWQRPRKSINLQAQILAPQTPIPNQEMPPSFQFLAVTTKCKDDGIWQERPPPCYSPLLAPSPGGHSRELLHL